MPINILQELNLGSAKPSFSRDEVASLADIKNLDVATKYPNNYEIYCREDGCKYRLNKVAHSTMQDNLPHPTGKWRRSDAVISSAMPAPITTGDVILYLGPTVMDPSDQTKVKYQTGKYYRTEWAKTSKQMYAFTQTVESKVWYSDTLDIMADSVLFTPDNEGGLFGNKDHAIIVKSAWDGESAITDYEYGDGSADEKPELIRDNSKDEFFDSYPVLAWKLFDAEAEIKNIKENVIPEAIDNAAGGIAADVKDAVSEDYGNAKKLADRFTDSEMNQLFSKVSEKLISSVNGVNDVDFRICACSTSDNGATITITDYMEAPFTGDLSSFHTTLPGQSSNTFDTIAVSCGLSFGGGEYVSGLTYQLKNSESGINTWLNTSSSSSIPFPPVAIYTGQGSASYKPKAFNEVTYYKTRVKSGEPSDWPIYFKNMEPFKTNPSETNYRVYFLVFLKVDETVTAEQLNAAKLFDVMRKAITPMAVTSGMLTEFDVVKENASSAVTNVESLSTTVESRMPAKTSNFIKENIFEDKTPVHMLASYSASYHGPGTYDNTNNNGLISIGSTYDHTDTNRSITPVFKNYFDPNSESADYVDASEVLAIKESEEYSNKASYIAIPISIGEETTKALLAESLTSIIGSFNPSYNYKMTLNGHSVDAYGTLVDIYAGIGNSDKIDNIGNVSAWTRLTENKFSASELVTSLSDIVYGTNRYLTLVLVYKVYYGDYPVFDSTDIIRIDSNTLIANTLNLTKNTLDERLTDIEEATGDVSALIETVNGISTSVNEVTTKVETVEKSVSGLDKIFDNHPISVMPQSISENFYSGIVDLNTSGFDPETSDASDIHPVFKNYFDSGLSGYVNPSTLMLSEKYVGVCAHLGKHYNYVADLKEAAKKITVRFNKNSEILMDPTSTASPQTDNCLHLSIKAIYLAVSTEHIAPAISYIFGVDKYKISNETTTLYDLVKDYSRQYNNVTFGFIFIFEITAGSSYSVPADYYLPRLNFEKAINQLCEISYNAVRDVEDKVAEVEDAIGVIDMEAVSEAATKVARLDPLTDDIIHSITDKELSEATIVGGDLFDWTDVFAQGTPPTSSGIIQNIKLRDIEQLLDYSDTCIFANNGFEETDETLDDGSSYHIGTMTTSEYYLYPYSTEYIDSLLTGESFYDNGIIDCSDSEGSDTVTMFLHNSSLSNRCLDVSTTIIFPDGQRWFPFNNKDEMLAYSINIELGSYTIDNINFDIDEVWIGITLYINYEYLSSMDPSQTEAQWALTGIANNSYANGFGTKFIRLAVRDLVDDSKNTVSLKLKDITGLSEEIQSMFTAVFDMAKEQGLDEERVKEIVDIRMSLMIPINTHIEEELSSFDVLGLSGISSEINNHISINKESGNFIENTISKLDTLSNKDEEFEKAFADLEPKLDGLTGDPSTEIIVGAATPSAAPSLDNRSISLGYDLAVHNYDGFPLIQISGSKVSPYSEEDISELANTSSVDSEFEGTLTFIGQVTANNGTSVNYNVIDYSNILRSKINIDASKMPEGFVLKKVVFGLIPCLAMEAIKQFTMLIESKQDLSKGTATIEIKNTNLNSFINVMMEELHDTLSQYALGVACFVDVGDKIKDASFLNDIDFSLFDQAITFITPGENRLNALPSLIEEAERTSKVSDAGFNLLSVIDESYNIADLSRLLTYKENYASLIRQTPIVPVTSNCIIENDEMVYPEKDFNGLVYLGDNYFSDPDNLKPEFKNYMDSSYASYTPLKDMLTELSGATNRRYIGLFGYFNIVDDGLNSRDTFRTAVSFTELKQTLKENGTYIDTSDYDLDNSSNEEKLRNGIAIPLGSDLTSVSSFCLSGNKTYVTVLNCNDYDEYKPVYYYNSKNVNQDINKFKWILCNPTDSLYDLVSKNFSEDDFDTSFGSRYCLGIITVLDINSLDGSFSEDENAKMYQDLAAMDFSSQMPKLCYAAFNKIADFDVAASNTKNIKESVGNINYKEFYATPIAFPAVSTDVNGEAESISYDALVYPRFVLPPELDSSTGKYTVRFHGDTDEEKQMTISTLADNGELYMFLSFFGENILHDRFGEGNYNPWGTQNPSETINYSILSNFNRVGGVAWYNTRYMKDNTIDFTQHGDYDTSELFLNIDSRQIRELYAAVIPNDVPANSISQYFTSEYNASTGEVIESFNAIPEFVKIPLGYFDEDLTGKKRTISLEDIIDRCGRPIYNASINPNGGNILFVVKLNETRTRVQKFVAKRASSQPFNSARYSDYNSAWNFGWVWLFHFETDNITPIEDPPCYITRSLDNSIKQAKNVALKAAQDAAADKTKVPTFYTSYSILKNDIQNGEMGYLVKVDPNNSSNYLADVYVKTLDGTIIKMSENVECEPSQSIINALNS